MLRGMLACAQLNLVASFALFVAFGFGGCGGSTPPPGEPPARGAEPPGAPTEPADPEPAAPEPSATAPEAPTAGGGETPASEASDAGATPPDVAAGKKDTRTAETIQAVVLSNRSRVRACYDKLRDKVGALSGDMTIRFTLDPKGKVKSAELNKDRSTIFAPALVECAVGELKKLSFPASSRGMEMTVNYPFNFKP